MIRLPPPQQRAPGGSPLATFSTLSPQATIGMLSPTSTVASLPAMMAVNNPSMNMLNHHPQLSRPLQHQQMMSMFQGPNIQSFQAPNAMDQQRIWVPNANMASNGGPMQFFMRSMMTAPSYNGLTQVPQPYAPTAPMAYSTVPNGIKFATPSQEYRTLEPAIAPSATARLPNGFRPIDGQRKMNVVTTKLTNDRPDASRVYFDRQAEKRIKLEKEEDEESDAGSIQEQKKRPKHAPGQGGKRRLKIDFTCLGEPGEDPQTCGKSGSIIPHNLRGRHEMHNQPWEFHITHEKTDGVTVIKWSVTNLTSGSTVSVTETPFQAKVRQKTGNTITSFVMRQALEQRVREFEQMLEKEDIKTNPLQVANLQSLIKDLRRKERNEGILFFGLRHEDVQQFHSKSEGKDESATDSFSETSSNA